MESACVVLSGGLSKRFNGDKLTATFRGKSVVSRVVENARNVTPHVYLSVASEAQGGQLLKSIGRSLEVIPDRRDLGLAGPFAAICSSLIRVRAREVLFLPADIPWVEPEALAAFVKICAGSSCDVGTLYWPGGRTENLIQFHQREKTLGILRKIAQMRKPITRASDAPRGATSTIFVSVGNITRNPYCFANVNRRSDLEHPRPRAEIGEGMRDVRVMGLAKRSYHRAIESQREERHLTASRSFEVEANRYQHLGINQIAVHCLQDSVLSGECAGSTPAGLRRRISELALEMNLAEAAGAEAS